MISKFISSKSLIIILLLSSFVIVFGKELYPHTPTEFYYDTLIDHFAAGGNSPTFPMRYIVNA